MKCWAGISACQIYKVIKVYITQSRLKSRLQINSAPSPDKYADVVTLSKIMQNEQTNRAEPLKTLPFPTKDADGYILQERRKRPTPGLSRYTIFGRRKGFYRESDHQNGGYIDHYSSRLFIVLVAILGLNVLDVILTMVILEHSGFELNPVVRSAIEVYGDRFWVWKYGIVSTCLLLLCLHIKFKGVKTIIILTCSIYVTVVLYQTFLIIKHFPTTF